MLSIVKPTTALKTRGKKHCFHRFVSTGGPKSHKEDTENERVKERERE